ncbi:regulator of chromosome condensation [Nematocida minor]|uniref:regulator of chromosome condensation n=1 Tax=Nematocida minor TaxID=1912983 RepID=UPI00221EEE97|nr:regulator of chromosome condensation [Nematocida minor]KAI5189458.1 regulator of chromosome condensation [Nematocida minor]
MQSKKYVTRVYTWGASDAGQLGVPVEEGMSSTPLEISYFNDKRIKTVVCGGMHSLALSIDGSLYSWGCNDEGVLGREGNEEEPAPVLFPHPVHIKKVVAGDSISAAVDIYDNLWTWGLFRGPGGVIGHSLNTDGSVNKMIRVPTVVPNIKVSAVEAGCNHLSVIDSKGRLITWGDGENCKLGRVLSKRAKATDALRPGIALNSVSAVATGAYHTLAVRRVSETGDKAKGSDKQCLYTEGCFFTMPSGEVYLYDQNRENIKESTGRKKKGDSYSSELVSENKKRKVFVESKHKMVKREEHPQTLTIFPPKSMPVHMTSDGVITEDERAPTVYLPCSREYPATTASLESDQNASQNGKDKKTGVYTYLSYAEEVQNSSQEKGKKSKENDLEYVSFDEVQRMALFDRRRKKISAKEEAKKIKLSSSGVNNYGQSPFSSASSAASDSSGSAALWGRWTECSPGNGPVSFKKGMGGEHSTHVLDSEGTLWAVGRNTFGQLGVGDSKDRKVFTKCLLSGVDDFSVTASHTLALKQGKVFSWGFGDEGQLGYEAENQTVPREVDLRGEVAISVGAGGQHSAAVTVVDATETETDNSMCIFGIQQ